MKIPLLAQYQGSKRILAPKILAYMPRAFKRLIEPFSGMASISIAAACHGKTSLFHINDINSQLIGMITEAVERPGQLIESYSKLWGDQFNYPEGHIEHFYHIRERFNDGDPDPGLMLYLMARCVKGSIRYGKNGKFNQSPDKRRHGTRPDNMRENILAISSLLRGKAVFSTLDYRETFNLARQGDILYMDPPYQGVCQNRDSRYVSGIAFDEFCESIEILNKNGIDYLISYDGACGVKTYGEELPRELKCEKVRLYAGLSTQQTLLGRRQTTYESLYISESLYLNHIIPMA